MFECEGIFIKQTRTFLLKLTWRLMKSRTCDTSMELSSPFVKVYWDLKIFEFCKVFIIINVTLDSPGALTFSNRNNISWISANFFVIFSYIRDFYINQMSNYTINDWQLSPLFYYFFKLRASFRPKWLADQRILRHNLKGWGGHTQHKLGWWSRFLSYFFSFTQSPLVLAMKNSWKHY